MISRFVLINTRCNEYIHTVTCTNKRQEHPYAHASCQSPPKPTVGDEHEQEDGDAAEHVAKDGGPLPPDAVDEGRRQGVAGDLHQATEHDVDEGVGAVV